MVIISKKIDFFSSHKQLSSWRRLKEKKKGKQLIMIKIHAKYLKIKAIRTAISTAISMWVSGLDQEVRGGFLSGILKPSEDA